MRLSHDFHDFRPNDFATLRLSGEGLRLWQSCRSPHGVGGFSFPRLIGGGFHRGGVGAAGVPA
nr:MAG TPA: hypothetical protein [Caudoviricetes sp.]